MTVDDRRAWELVLSHIETQLVEGRLQPGDHLPPERALAGELDVGRSSVREAVRVLEVMGLIRTQTGSGPNSGAIIVARPNGGMQALMRLQVAASGFPVADVVRTRLLLETAVVAELADRSPAERPDRTRSSRRPHRRRRTPRRHGCARAHPAGIPRPRRAVPSRARRRRRQPGRLGDDGRAAQLHRGLRARRRRAPARLGGHGRPPPRRAPQHPGGHPRRPRRPRRTLVHDHITDYYRDSRLTPTRTHRPHDRPNPDRNTHHG